ncbi:MAG TPA: right-handed parallel beta-helix repeat-containing protein [Candidatus Acidoferrum sp.]|nr:right-handed parallel beta-helix repeat-containing protein [Candidatus Acidoferrum sp.]
MKGRLFSVLMITLIFLGMNVLEFNVRPAKADAQTIYINADGSIAPAGAPISTSDNVTFTFVGNISYPTYLGIIVEKSNIVIDGNGFTIQGDQNGIGLDLEYVNNVTIRNTNVRSFRYGIILDYSSNSMVSGNNITENGIYGIYLDSSSNCDISGNNITTSNMSGIVLDFSNNNSVSRNVITNLAEGIVFADSSDNFVTGNNITANSGYGIILDHSSDNSISQNNISANTYEGIWLAFSSNNSIWENNVAANTEVGIRLETSDNISIAGNNITENGIYGIYLDSSSNCDISGNNMTANNYGIWLISCFNNRVSGNDAANNLYGIVVWSSSNNSISANDIANNSNDGLYLIASSSYNSLIGNNVTDNDQGISVGYSSNNNYIYHNDFVNNVIEAFSSSPGSMNTNFWDSGYILGGNYWSDYNGTDFYSGPYQNITGGDRIGDTPYVIDSKNVDHYPLMQPWTGSTIGHDVAVTNITANRPWMYQGFIADITVNILNRGDFTENVNVTLYYNMTVGETIGTQTITIPSGENETLPFIWDTEGLPYNQNYTLTAVATVALDNNPAENTLAAGPITIRIMGDLTGDGKVDIRDIALVARSFGSYGPNFLYQGSPLSPGWNSDCDLNGDNKVDIRDIALVARNFGK